MMVPSGETVVPPADNPVTVHLSGWEVVQKPDNDPDCLVLQLKDTKSHTKPHQDIVNLAKAALARANTLDANCVLFSSLQSAEECIRYSTTKSHQLNKPSQSRDKIQIRAFRAKDIFYAVLFPPDHDSIISEFWASPGTGISSRFAEDNFAYVHRLEAVVPSHDQPHRTGFDDEVHQFLRESIVSYLERLPSNPLQQSRPSASDVYLYQSGMASIYKPHTYMLDRCQGAIVLFGPASTSTLSAFEEFSPGFRFFGQGSDQDLKNLVVFLEEERRDGRKVQAVWARFPTNPLLVTPDITKLRELADEYDVVLGIDGTIGSWANLDIATMADIFVTSIANATDGHADATAGCAILNPASPRYDNIKPLFNKYYVSELYVEDAKAIKQDSRYNLSHAAMPN